MIQHLHRYTRKNRMGFSTYLVACTYVRTCMYCCSTNIKRGSYPRPVWYQCGRTDDRRSSERKSRTVLYVFLVTKINDGAVWASDRDCIPVRGIPDTTGVRYSYCRIYCNENQRKQLVYVFVEELVAPPSKRQLQKLKTTPDVSTALTALPKALLLVLVSLHASARELSRLLP